METSDLVPEVRGQVRLSQNHKKFKVSHELEPLLGANEAQLLKIFHTIPEGIVIQYADGKIHACNASAERILGLTIDQMMGRTSFDPRWRAIHEDGSVFPGDEHPAIMTLKTGTSQSNVIMGIHKPDASLTWISITTQPLFHPDEPKPYAVVASFFEITQRKQAEEERVKLVQEQAARTVAETAQQQSAFLAEVSAVLSSSLDYEQTLQSVAQLAVPYFADWCSVDLLNPDRSISRVAVAHQDPEKVDFGWQVAKMFPRHLDESYGISKVMQTGQVEFIPEITDELLVASVQNPEYLRILREVGLRSCIIAPLEARGRVLGSISFVLSESERKYKKSDIALAEDLARRAAIAIDNARLYQETQQARMAAEQAADRMVRLFKVTAALSESLTPHQVAEVIVEQAITALNARSALVALLNEAETELEIIQIQGYEHPLTEEWRKFPLSSPVPLAEAVRTGQPIWETTIEERIKRYPNLADSYSKYDSTSWISVPLIVKGRAVGGLSLSFTTVPQLSEDDRAFILALAQQSAQAIDRARLYEAEQTARAEAEAANQVKDQFLAIVSHELRTPLNSILGWAQILRSRKTDEKTMARALETIERNARSQSQLINDLLDVSRILRNKIELRLLPIDLVSVIEAAIESVRLTAEAKNIALETEFNLKTDLISADSERLQQVIWNLLTNAIKFTPQGGRVSIRLQPLGDAVELQVKDTGMGISPDFLPHIFEYFRQADGTITRAHGGLGLGLAIVRHIVELHGGTVRADSLGEGQGATFTVTLPLNVAHGKESELELGSNTPT